MQGKVNQRIITYTGKQCRKRIFANGDKYFNYRIPVLALSLIHILVPGPQVVHAQRGVLLLAREAIGIGRAARRRQRAAERIVGVTVGDAACAGGQGSGMSLSLIHI